MISICLPTRGRPQMFKEMWESALTLANRPDDVEFVVYRDLSDDVEYDYPPNIQGIVSNDTTFSVEWYNECCRIATGPIYMFIADDFIFQTGGWDGAVKGEFDKCKDKILFVCLDGEDWEKWGFATVGFLHKNWIDTVGYMLPPFKACADKWVNEVATQLGRRVRLEGINIKHVNCRDELHKERNRISKNERWRKNYYEDSAVEGRNRDVKLLKGFIDETINSHTSVGKS